MDFKELFERIMSGCASNKDWYAAYLRCNDPRIKADADFVARNVSPKSHVLDIGGVPPLFLGYLSSFGFASCSLADPNPDPFVAYLESANINYCKLDILNHPQPELKNRFDLVCLNEVIEHIGGDLLGVISNALDCVKPGGMVMVTTPNLRSVWGMYSLLWKSCGLAAKPEESVRAQYERESSTYGYYGHVREYTKKEIVDLMLSFDLTLVNCEFQKDYRPHGWVSGPLGFIESLLPDWRLFGKYLFRKAQ